MADSGVIESKELGALIKDVTGDTLTPMELDKAMRQLDEDGGGTCITTFLNDVSFLIAVTSAGTITWQEFKHWFFQQDADDDLDAPVGLRILGKSKQMW